jgi:glycosyltransferase involved in cell wall biosynthesis
MAFHGADTYMLEHRAKITPHPGRVAVYGFRPGPGGISHVMRNLMHAMVDEGVRVDLLIHSSGNSDLQLVRPEVRIVELGRPGLFSEVSSLVRYLRETLPLAILSNRERATRSAVRARKIASLSTPIFIRVGTTLSIYLRRRSPLQRWLRRFSLIFYYRRVDGIIAVSEGVARDVAILTGVSRGCIHVIHNPTIPIDFDERASEPVDHPWFASNSLPVILAVGRLARPKDYPTLLRAFARLHDRLDCRLVILGEGKERARLEALATALGISEHVDLPGHAVNPYSYMRRASLFVLSSLWEGSPNVLIEALAAGTPVVSTDCENGPREILADGRYGTLVPVGDPDALAEAMRFALESPSKNSFVKLATERYRAERNVGEYFRVMGIEKGPRAPRSSGSAFI